MIFWGPHMHQWPKIGPKANFGALQKKGGVGCQWLASSIVFTQKMCDVISNIHDQSFFSILWGRWTNDHPQHNQIWLELKNKSRKFFKLHGRPVAYKNLCSKYGKIHFFPSKCANLGLFNKNPLDNLQPFYYLSPNGEICPPKNHATTFFITSLYSSTCIHKTLTPPYTHDAYQCQYKGQWAIYDLLPCILAMEKKLFHDINKQFFKNNYIWTLGNYSR